jgi:hypothetical protein
MADLPSHPDTHDAGDGHGRGPATGGAPRWLGVVGTTVAIMVVALLIVLHLTGVLGPGGH